MTTREWLMTPYFWIPVAVSCILFGWLYWYEKKKLTRRKTCPTCYSNVKRVRYQIRYWLSDLLYNDQLCDDPWHNE